MRTLLLTALLCAPLSPHPSGPMHAPRNSRLPPRRAPAAHSQGGPPSGRPLSMQEFASKVPELLQDVQLPANMPPQRIFQQLDVNKNRLLDAKEQQTLRADVQKILASNANRKAGGAIRSEVVRGLAAQHGVTPEVIFFRFVMGQGMIPLTVRAQLSSYLP